MRILVLTNLYPPHAYGGYELACRDVVESWRAGGHEVLVLTSDVRVPAADVPGASEPPDVWRHLHLYWARHEILNPALSTRYRWERDNQRTLGRALSEFRPDVVSAWAMGAMSLGILSALGRRAVPVVLVLCDEWPAYGPVVDAWVRPLSRRPRLARLVHHATRLPTTLPPLDTIGPACFCSDFLRRAARERTPWSFPDSGVVLLGIASGDFPSEAVRAPRAWNWRLLYVGRIDARKGIDTVVRALAGCPDEATLEVLGRGDDRYLDELHRLVRELDLGGRVTFSACPRAELARSYAAADVLVFPSVWEEPFGLVPVEAMACGTPVVATPVGGAAEFLIDGTNCLTFEPNEPKELSDRLTRLADDLSLRARLVEGGRATADELRIERLSEVLDAWNRYAAHVPGSARPADRVLDLGPRPGS